MRLSADHEPVPITWQALDRAATLDVTAVAHAAG